MNARILPFGFLLLLIVAGVWWLNQEDRGAATGLDAQGGLGATETHQDPESAELEGAAGALQETELAGAERSAVQAAENSPEAEGQAGIFAVGRVVDSGGQPIAGAQISEQQSTDTGVFRKVKRGEVLGESDGQGRFRFEVDAERLHPFVVVAAGFQELIVPAPGDEQSWELGDLILERAMVLEGRVVDVRGVGIHGVRIFAPLDGIHGGPLSGSGDGRDPMGVTDASGAFRLDGLKPGPWRFLLHSDEFCDRIETGEMPQGLVRSGLLWALEDGLVLNGRVLGMPALEERDLVASLQYSGGPELEEVLGGSTSDLWIIGTGAQITEGGLFRAQGLHPGGEYDVVVMPKEEHGSFWADTGAYLTDRKTVPAEIGSVDLSWIHKARLRLKVVDGASGAPIESFEVDSKQNSVSDALEGMAHQPRDGGVFVAQEIPPQAGRVQFEVTAEGYEIAQVEVNSLPGGVETDLGKVALQAAHTVRIQVVDGASNLGVEGARVSLESVPEDEPSDLLHAMLSAPKKGGPSRHGKTDSQGFVEIQWNLKRSCRVEVSHDDFAERTIDVGNMVGFQENAFQVLLSRGGSLLVTVVDSRGEPAANQMVKCAPYGGAQAGNGAMTVHAPGGGGDIPDSRYKKRTPESGQVLFTGLAPGEYSCELLQKRTGSLMIFIAPGEEKAEPEMNTQMVREGEQATLQLVAKGRGQLEGKVREDGQPLARAEVVLAPEDRDNAFPLRVQIMAGQAQMVETEPDGSYRLEGLEVGRYDVFVMHTGRAMAESYSMEIKEGEQQRSFDLSVAVVSGKVVDASGNPVPGLTISVKPKDGQGVGGKVKISTSGGGGQFQSVGGGDRLPVVTNAQGDFELRGVQTGKPILVSAAGEGYQKVTSAPIEVSEGGRKTGLELVANRAGSILVSYLNSAGAPGGMAQVQLKSLDNETAPEKSGVTDEGVCELTGLAPGRYRLWIESDFTDREAKLPDPVEVTVVAGEQTPATLKR